jgi:hypothetical protein
MVVYERRQQHGDHIGLLYIFQNKESWRKKEGQFFKTYVNKVIMTFLTDSKCTPIHNGGINR